jgi:DNA replication protein DnaC
VLDTLFHVLNTRYSDRCVTLITSNFEDRVASARGGGVPESIEDVVGTRVLSRLHEMCTRLVLEGQDYRRKEAGEKRR